MRLLHAGLSDAGGRRARTRAGHHRRRPARRAVVESVPLHRLPEHHQGRARRGRKRCAGNDGPGQIRRPFRSAPGRPAAPHRPGPLRRRHLVSRPTAHARGALAGRARRRSSIDATAALALPGVQAVWTSADVAQHSADPVPADRPARRSSPTASRCWRRTSCAMSASRSRWSLRKTHISPKTPPIWSRLLSNNCRATLLATEQPGRLRADGAKLSTEAADPAKELWRRRRRLPRRARRRCA